MIAIAPPGCECQPEEPPGVRVIFATTISKPCLMGRLARDISVPRPKITLENPTDGVAAPGIALSATNNPAKPSEMTAGRMPRFVGVFIPLSLSRPRARLPSPRLDNALLQLARRPYAYGSFYGDSLDSVPVEQGYTAAEGIGGKVRMRAVGAQLTRTKLNPDRFLIRPYALAGSPRELLFAGLCSLLLGVIFVAEILTPHVVVGAFALLPLLAALWVLSSRPAALVAIVATAFFFATAAIETGNRMTVILLGVAVLGTGLIARFYASGLASVLSSRHHIRPTIKSWFAPATPDGTDRTSQGVRSLTRRELDVARLAAEGYTAAEIGRRLSIGGRTVDSHLASVYSKLRISSRLQLIRMASSLGAPA